MQAEIDALDPATGVAILGVNGPGLEAGNEAMCQGRQLPWLQDTAESDVWNAWGIAYRDVLILDGENRVLQAYNLTTHDLGNPAAYEELKSILLGAAQGESSRHP
jgi:hypothetical protein